VTAHPVTKPQGMTACAVPFNETLMYHGDGVEHTFNTHTTKSVDSLSRKGGMQVLLSQIRHALEVNV